MLGDIDELGVKPSPHRGMTPRIFEFLFARIRAVTFSNIYLCFYFKLFMDIALQHQLVYTSSQYIYSFRRRKVVGMKGWRTVASVHF